MANTSVIDGTPHDTADEPGHGVPFAPPTGPPKDTAPPGLIHFLGRHGRIHALVAMLLVGLGFDAAMRNDTWSVAGALWITAGALAVATSPGLPRTRLWALAAIPYGAWFAVRSSEWLLWPDLLAASAVICWAATSAESGLIGIVRRGEALLGSVFTAPVAIAEAVAGPARGIRRRRGLGSVARGVAIAAPIVLVLGALLASGDAFFASWLSPDVSAGPTLLHIAVVVIGGLGAAWLLAPRPRSAIPDTLRRPRLGDIEVVVVLGAVTVLFGAWAAAQVVAALGGRDTVIETSGLTFAEWARNGFFQLLWVAALTLGLLVLLRAAALRERLNRLRTALSLVVVALTLTMVVMSLVKLDLYADEFGLTMLRVYVTVFAWWLGLLFVVVAASLLSVRVRMVALRAGVVTALLGVFAMNVADPEAVVVDANLHRAERGERFDAGYLGRLGPDGLVRLAESSDGLDGELRDAVVVAVCSPRVGTPSYESDVRGSWVPDRRGGDGFLGWNAASRRLESLRADLC